MTNTPTAVRKTSSKASQYSVLLEEVKKAGLLKKTPAFYVKRLVGITVISLALWAAVYFIAQSGSSLIALIAIPTMIFMGIMAAQYAFIAHESAHRQVFHSNKLNDFVGLILANLMAGLSYGFWMRKHNRHHAKPNQVEGDPDINIRVLAFRPQDVAAKPMPERFITKHQGKLFPFLLLFTGFDLLLDSFVSVMRKDKRRKKRFTEFALMVIRQSTPIIVLLLLFPPLYAGVLWLLMMMSFGLFMGGAFAPNHKGMPLVPKDSKINFFQRQVLTSRNIKSTWLTDNLMGGLNFQVEHHLFPSMSRPHLKEAHKIVTRYCNENGIPFKETGLFESYGIVIRYLDKVGLSTNSNPFVCPMIAELRPRA
jgi:fatty acid desaturase